MSQIRVLHFPLDALPTLLEVEQSMKSFQQLVGDDYFEAYPAPDGSVLFASENGRWKFADQPNVHANRFLTSRYAMAAKMLGPVFLVGAADDHGNSTDVPDELVAAAEALGYPVRSK